VLKLLQRATTLKVISDNELLLTGSASSMSLIPLVQDAIRKRHLPPEQEACIANELEYREIDDTELAALSLLEALIANGMIAIGHHHPAKKRTVNSYRSTR